MNRLLLVFMVGCAQGAEVSPSDLIAPPEGSAPPPPAARPPEAKGEPPVCYVERVDRRSPCVVYTLRCAGELDYILACDVRPVGAVTEPPRPVLERL